MNQICPEVYKHPSINASMCADLQTKSVTEWTLHKSPMRLTSFHVWRKAWKYFLCDNILSIDCRAWRFLFPKCLELSLWLLEHQWVLSATKYIIIDFIGIHCWTCQWLGLWLGKNFYCIYICTHTYTLRLSMAGDGVNSVPLTHLQCCFRWGWSIGLDGHIGHYGTTHFGVCMK